MYVKRQIEALFIIRLAIRAYCPYDYKNRKLRAYKCHSYTQSAIVTAYKMSFIHMVSALYVLLIMHYYSYMHKAAAIPSSLTL
jgi:hypothetical protein